jgi:hypothetical protein
MRPDPEVRAARVVLGRVVPGRVVLGLADPVVRAAPVVLGPVLVLVLGLVARVDPVALMDPVVLLDRRLLGLAVRVVRVVLALVGLAGHMSPAARVDRPDLDRMDRADQPDRAARVVPARVDPAGPMDRTGLVGPVVQDLMALAAPVALVALAGLAAPMARAVLGDLAALTTAAPAVLMARVVPVGLGTAGLVAPVGRHRRHMCHRVTMTVLARSGVVRGTHRTASALQVTARRHLRPRTDSGGTAGLLPERRRPIGTVHRLPAVGTVRRPPEAGTHAGTDRRTISVGDRRTMARSTTTDSTPHRSSTRCLAVGASGSSVPGSRCTDLTPA